MDARHGIVAQFRFGTTSGELCSPVVGCMTYCLGRGSRCDSVVGPDIVVVSPYRSREPVSVLYLEIGFQQVCRYELRVGAKDPVDFLQCDGLVSTPW